MNSTVNRLVSLAATTAAVAVVGMVQSDAAQAYLINRTSGVPPSVNPPLAPPTVIDFNSLNGFVPNTADDIGPGVTGDGLNGGATIQRTPGTSANYVFFNDTLRIGAGDDGEVTFRFDDPRGMGYFGFFFESTTTAIANISISFLSGATEIETFTGTQLAAITNGSGNYFNFFVTENSEIFDGVVFADASNGLFGGSYRIDDVAYQAIPTPALLPGLLALGAGIIRKRKAEAEAEA